MIQYTILGEETGSQDELKYNDFIKREISLYVRTNRPLNIRKFSLEIAKKLSKLGEDRYFKNYKYKSGDYAPGWFVYQCLRLANTMEIEYSILKDFSKSKTKRNIIYKPNGRIL
jgi:hypothetical protein